MAKRSPVSPTTVYRPDPRSLNPLVIGAGMIRYLGGTAILLATSSAALVRPGRDGTSLFSQTVRQVDRLVGLSFGVVAAVHVGMGSFLAMQAYFGATFVAGIGPVVGVGLIRNLAPLLVGFLLAILVAVLYVADLQSEDLDSHPDRHHQVASRVLAAMVAGPILAAWGALIGVGVGFLAARAMMGVTEPMFFDLFLEMLWARDIVGLVVKGAAFGGVAALLACYEAVRPPARGEKPGGMTAISRAACRALVLACLAILVINAGWFVFLYHAGPAFGPTLLTPPGQ